MLATGGPIPEVGTDLLPPRTLDELVLRLRERRVAAMSPSFTEIARRVRAVRAERGLPASEQSPGRVTIYDCFREGRQRIRASLVLDILAALGADADEIERWRGWCQTLQRRPVRSAVVTARPDLPPILTPSAYRREIDQVRAAGTTMLVGMPGAGKTQVGVVALTSMIERGRLTGAITVDVGGSDPSRPQVSAEAILDGLDRLLGEDGGDQGTLAARAARLAGRLAERRIALLLDDVASGAQVAPLVAAVRTTPVVITSRLSLTVDRGHRVMIAGWTLDEGTGFLAQYLGGDRVDTDPESARTIVELTGGLPLAMVLTATRISQRSDWTLADHAGALRTQLEQFHLNADVSAALRLSYDSLAAPARRMLRLCATQPLDRVPAIGLGPLLGTTSAIAEAVLTQLEATHLADRGPAGSVGMHALVRTFAAAESLHEETRADREEAIDRLALTYLRSVRQAAAAAYPLEAAAAAHPRDGVEADQVADLGRSAALIWFAAEISHVVELAEHLADRRPDLTLALLRPLFAYIDAQSAHLLEEPIYRIVMACAHQLGDAQALAEAEHRLGRCLVRDGDPAAEGYLRRSADLAREAGLPRTELGIRNTLAMDAVYRGDLAAALESFSQVRALTEPADYPQAWGTVTDNIGVVLRYTGEFDRAKKCHRDAAAFFSERGDDARTGAALSNLAEVHVVTGELEAAVEVAESAIRVTREVAVGRHAHALTTLGRARSGQGLLTEALTAHQQALAGAATVGEPTLLATVHTNLALCLADLGRAAKARAHLEEAHRIATESDSHFELGRALVGLARQDLADQDRSRARDRLRRAVGLFATFAGPEADEARSLWASLGS
ncbi:MAG: tetratricopeptide repeat protein [Propioniciclava sp.]